MRLISTISVIVSCLATSALADMKLALSQAKAGKFEASDEIRCAQEVGEMLQPCEASLARDAASAVLVVTFPNGFKRMLMFEGGEFLRGNTTMSGVGTDTDWSLSNGSYRVRVDDQQFEIPASLISGK